MNFTKIANGQVEGFCLIRSVECKTGKNGEYLNLTLADKTGEINGKVWRYSAREHGEYENNQIVKVRGVIREFGGSDQLNIERIRPQLPEDDITLEDLVRTTGYSGEEMYNEIYNIASSFEDEDLKKLVITILDDRREALLYWPAAFKLHHALNGGLLMHTLSIVRLAEGVCKVYPFVDRDLLFAGAILHDIAKLEEFTVADTGIAEGYSVAGTLLGHLAMGAMTVSEYAKRLQINEKTAMLVEHMILSHHGEPEFGAAVRPLFLEAELLSELDLMDSRIFEMREAVSPLKPDQFTGRQWALNDRKLYHHARKALDDNVNLF
ncbi:MAG: HD domain-containing protein [Clostridia bacterium]|nr:HD domain-containing protein [Clostridia bacterium]